MAMRKWSYPLQGLKLKRIDPYKIQADWSRYERRAPWSVITSRELAEILGVHLQTINNWAIRGVLPLPVKHPRLRGNKNHYRISTIRAWLNGTDEDSEAWAWIDQHTPYGFNTLEQAQEVCRTAWKVLEIERPLLP